MNDARRIIITARAISVRGNDIDTDRIIPARFVKSVIFDGLGEHAFADERTQLKKIGKIHPLDNSAYAKAQIMFVNKNFGCGSSREHAPQAIMRWGKGIKAIVGESFSEIFFGNCVALGIPCHTADEPTLQELMALNETNPKLEFHIDLKQLMISFEDKTFSISMSEGPRKQFLSGRWDSALELLEAKERVAVTAAKLPYFDHWK